MHLVILYFQFFLSNFFIKFLTILKLLGMDFLNLFSDDVINECRHEVARRQKCVRCWYAWSSSTNFSK